MVNPTTGPFVTSLTRSVKGPASFSRYKNVWKQAKPYNLALPYYLQQRNCLASNFVLTGPDNASGSSGNPAAGGTRYFDFNTVETYDAKFKAMQKLRSRITDRAEWLVNLAERKQAAKMVADRGFQLLAFAVAAARRDFRGIARALNVAVKAGVRPKTAGAIWLEYHFGWSPLIQDIYTGIDILQHPFSAKKVFASARTVRVNEFFNDNVNYYTRATETVTVNCRLGCEFRVTNPNLWRANQLGMINPAALAWELVPFSFVVDWFVPVSSFLNSFTEWVGLTVDSKWTTLKSQDLVFYTQQSKIGSSVESGNCTMSAFCMHRHIALPEASLRPPTPGSLSVTRAATAISLLLQQMRS
jgi:hypothetical protein